MKNYLEEHFSPRKSLSKTENSHLFSAFVRKINQLAWSDPSTQYLKKARHQLYVQALRPTAITIVFGKFKDKDHRCRVCGRKYSTFEEKQTDVNIAITLFRCAIHNEFDTAIIVSGDSDLVPAIEAVKKTFPAKEMGLVVPIGRRAKELMEVCDFHMKMKEKHLKTSQFPDTIILDPAKNISIQRPPSWK